MKLLFSLVLLIALYSFGVLSAPTSTPTHTPIPAPTYLSIQNFNYGVDVCNNSNTDSSEELNICSSDNQVGLVYALTGACVAYNGQYSIFELTEDNLQVNQTNFEDNACSTFNNQFYHNLNDCFVGCDSNPTIFSIVQQSAIVTPKNSFFEAVYSGNCKNNWNQNVELAVAFNLNQCITLSMQLSIKLSCNATTLTVQESNASDCTTSDTTTYLKIGQTSCGFENGLNGISQCSL